MGNNNSTKFKLEHAYDPEAKGHSTRPTKASDSDDSSIISTVSGSIRSAKTEESQYLSTLETPEERSNRKRSHWIAYITMCIMSIGFSIGLSGTWPYLVELSGEDEEDDLSKTALGWVIAANPLGQMLASPIIGKLGNKFGEIRYILYCSIVIFIFGQVLYAFLPFLDDVWVDSYYHLMILSRFIVGVSTSNVTLCRSYVAASTTKEERTKGIASISASQALGFVIGPAIQMILSLVIKDDINKYNTTGYVAAILGIINLVLVTPFFFTEYNIAEKERQILKSQHGDTDEPVLPKPDTGALIAILIAFFLVQFILTLIETLMEPFMQDQYEWCADVAVIVVGVAFVLVGFLTIAMFLLSAKFAQIMDERKVFILCGFVPLCIGVFLFLPWGDEMLTYCSDDYTTTLLMQNHTQAMTTEPTTMAMVKFLNDNPGDIGRLHPQQILRRARRSASADAQSDSYYRDLQDIVDDVCDEDDCLGCPDEQDWCENYPKLNIVQFCFAFFITFIGYPFAISMANTIYSKMLGPKPQGTMMGILTASGSFARVIGPIFVTYVYTNLGTRVNFGILFVMMIIGLLIVTAFYKRLVPMKVPEVEHKGKY